METGIRRVESSLVWIQRMLDTCLPGLLLYLVTYLYAVHWHDRYIIMALSSGLLFVFLSQANGIYRNWHEPSIFSNTRALLKSWAWTSVALLIIAFIYKDTHNFSRLVIGSWTLLTPIVLISYRLLLRRILAKYRLHSAHNRQIAIVGAGKVGQRIAKLINDSPWLGYSVIAFFDDNASIQSTSIQGIPVIGTTDDVLHNAQNKLFDELYICLPLRSEHKIKQFLNELADTTVIVKYIPDFFTFDLIHAKWSEINGIPIISVYDTPLTSRTLQTIKRSEDLILSTLIMLLISPLLIAIAAGVKFSSPGPILFKQTRYGLNGKEIRIYKFRSMTALDNGDVIQQATKNDPRLTPFGAFLRKTSLDELPQFFNVWQGKMSIVGPRPHAVAHNEQYRKLVPKYMQRHIVKPGITGWAQINGWRGETDTLEKMQKRIEFDLHYINNWSLWLDIKIILLTMVKGFINKNAY